MHSEQINEIAKALAKAQGEIKNASKDTINPHFKSKYADLASVWDACREALSKNDIAVVQPIETNGDIYIVTLLMHSSGQWIKGKVPVKVQQATPQALGSAITYMRRYSLAAMVGVAPDDDDGEGAMDRNGATVQHRPESPSPARFATAKEKAKAGEAILNNLRLCSTVADVNKLAQETKADMERIAKSDKDLAAELKNRFQDRRDEITDAARMAVDDPLTRMEGLQ